MISKVTALPLLLLPAPRSFINLDQRFTDRQKIRELESRVAELQTTLNHRDQEVARLRRDEEQRLHFLRTAIVDYIGTGTKNI